jgi:hypothetical protein
MRSTAIILMAILTQAGGLSWAGGETAAAPEQKAPSSLESFPQGWPAPWGARTLQHCEHALAYAQKKSAVDEVAKLLRTAVNDARQDWVTEPAGGLLVVVDVQEKSPIDLARFTQILNDPNVQIAADDSKRLRDSLEQTRTLSKQGGTDMNSMAFVKPIAIRPAALRMVAPEFPEGLEREMAWCVIVPTDKYVAVALKAVTEAALKSGEIGWKERLLIKASLPLVLRKAEGEGRKERQADLYRILVGAQKEWSAELKADKVKAYRLKLGLDRHPKSKGEQEQTKAGQTDEGKGP